MRIRFLIFLAFTSPAIAQPARVTHEVGRQHWLTARIIPRGSDSLIVLLDETAAPDTLPMHDFALVERYRGRRINPPRVVICTIGGLALGVIAGGIASSVYGNSGGEFGAFGAPGLVLLTLGAGTAVGLAVGLYPERSWQQVHASPAARAWIESRRPWP